MTYFHVKRSSLKGEISIPPSKSHTLRAILFGSLGKGKTVIHNPLQSPDATAMIHACRLFGAKIELSPNKIEIEGLAGKIEYTTDVINAGNSGIVFRFCCAIGALSKNPVVITGDESIRYQRPILPLIEGLTQLGVDVKTMRGDGRAPIIVQGPLKPGTTSLDGEDSQPVSALLIASSFLNGPTEIHVRNPGEKPWVGLTLHWLNRLGIGYQNHDYHHYRVSGNANFEGFEYHVPGDFSSAAFPIAAALITASEITVHNVDFNDCQGDKELISVFKKMGANIEIEENKVHLRKTKSFSGIEVDVNDFIDAVPILAVAACHAEGKTRIYNASIAKQKECNRLQCIASELRKMGADIQETEDGLVIHKSSLKGAHVHSHQDHRMAMALAVAALSAEGQSKIESIHCVAKTFPSFVHDFQALGAHIHDN